MLKKIITGLIILSMIVTAVSCTGEQPVNNTIDTTAAQTDSEAVEAETEPNPFAEVDELPVEDLNGFSLDFVSEGGMGWCVKTIVAEESTGEPINDEIYARNVRIETSYNCKITDASLDDVGAAYYRLQAAGDAPYDVMMIGDGYIMKYMKNIGFLNWNDISYIELGNPWWLGNANSDYSIYDYQYAITGAFSLAMYPRPFILLYNKTAIENDNMNIDIYGAVKDGTWTYDMMYDSAKNFTADLNGDSVLGEGDRFAAAGNPRIFYLSLVAASGARYVSKDDEGGFYFSMKDEHAINVLDKIAEGYFHKNIYNGCDGDPAFDNGVAFAEGRLLYHASTIGSLASFRDSEADFGVVPFPKYDEAQEQYYCITSNAVIAALPLLLPEDDRENVGLLIEAMTRDSYVNLINTYINSVVTYKYVRDEESAEMIQIIFQSMSFDPGYEIWNTAFYGLENLFKKQQNTFASYLESVSTTMNNAITKSNKEILALKNG